MHSIFPQSRYEWSNLFIELIKFKLVRLISSRKLIQITCKLSLMLLLYKDICKTTSRSLVTYQKDLYQSPNVTQQNWFDCIKISDDSIELNRKVRAYFRNGQISCSQYYEYNANIEYKDPCMEIAYVNTENWFDWNVADKEE